MHALRLATLAFLAAPALAQSVGEWRIESHGWKRELPAGLPIAIENPYGEVRVRAFEGQGCELAGVSQRHRDDPRPIDLEPVLEADRLVVAVRMPATAEDGAAPPEWGRRRVDLTIYVPASSPLTVRTGDGAVEVKGSTTPVAVATRNGAILIESQGPLTAETDAGDVSVLLASPAWAHEAAISTRTGDVRLAVRRDARARLEVETRGRIATDFSIEIDSVEPGLKRGRLVLGDGAGTARIRSHQGEVTLAEEPIASPLPVDRPDVEDRVGAHDVEPVEAGCGEAGVIGEDAQALAQGAAAGEDAVLLREGDQTQIRVEPSVGQHFPHRRRLGEGEARILGQGEGAGVDDAVVASGGGGDDAR